MTRDTVTGFERAARQRQGTFRDHSPTISSQGRSPLDQKGLRNRHLLALGAETENLYPGVRGAGGAGDFFRRRGIGWWKSARSGDSSAVDVPTRNMASSQVACVNFLLPLAGIPGALTRVLRAIDADVIDVAQIYHEGNTAPVEFEWVGTCGTLEGKGSRGANATSIDAFLVAETSAGRRRAYLLEWKYVEHCLHARPTFKGAGKAGKTRRGRYGDLFAAADSAFDSSAVALDAFLFEPFYQLMRQRLLADRMVRRREMDVDEAKVVVVVPEANRVYRMVALGSKTTSPPLARRFPQLATVEAVMHATLKDPAAQFGMVAPADLLEGVIQEFPDETSAWATYWWERYGV